MNGVLVLDKPQGPTSFDLVAQTRRALSVRRVGHAGTLDPMATGVLLLCIGEGTKLVPYLMDADKEYRATLLLGATTDTDDAGEGARVTARAEPARLGALTEAQVREVLRAFVGTIVQRPPRYSALKVAGERLYDLARAGAKDLEAQLDEKQRPVSIHEITVEEVALPEVRLLVRCGKGTYIRALARDVGERLGVGGHLTALRRLRVGRFTVADSSPLSQPRLYSLPEALAHLPSVLVGAEQAARLRSGQRATIAECGGLLPLDAPPREGQAGVVLDEAGRLAAVLVCTAGAWGIGRGFCIE